MTDAPTTQRTLVLVKPDGVRRGLSGEIVRRIEAKGYTLVAVELREADEALLAEHYAEHAGKPFLTQPGRLTEAVQKAVNEATGLTPELSTSGGTSDGRFIAPYGIDVVELGPINATIHKVNETVLVEDLERLEHIYFRIAELLLT